MAEYVVYVYTADMFTYTKNGVTYEGLPAEASSGQSSVVASSSSPLTVTLKAGSVPIPITIRDMDTGSTTVAGSNWVTHINKFDEVSRDQTILGGDYNPGAHINAAYTLSGATAYNGNPLSLVSYRLNGDQFGRDTGPVQGILSSEGLVPGMSYDFTSAVTTQTDPDYYPDYYDPTDPPPPCFTSGTLIMTDAGEIPVEDLRAGDMVMTIDNGLKPVRWITSREMDASWLKARPELRPICIEAHAFGHGVPHRDLLVSPQHRILLRSRLAERMFADREILVAAKHLVGLPGIRVDECCSEVTYWHFLMDGHEVVFSNGAATESLYTGEQAMRSLLPEQRKEILTLFPECVSAAASKPARLLAPGRRVRNLVRRAGHSRDNLFN